VDKGQQEETVSWGNSCGINGGCAALLTDRGCDMNSILNPQFRYINAASTNIAKTFAKARKALAEQAKKDAESQAEAQRKVANIKGRK
jgi:septal ring factor EnvC (AmiA/AmiB activator)